MGLSSRLFIALALGAFLAAAEPSSWALWTARITLPADISIQKTERGGDHGWGVDLNISKSMVDASIWDDDGDAFFMLKRGSGFCKVSVGSNGLGPGLDVEIFQQHGLVCDVVSGTGGPKDYVVTLSADDHLHADCDSTSTNMPDLCNKTWRAPDAKLLSSGVDPESEYLWTAMIVLPANANIRKVQRGADRGWGVDLKIINNTVQAGIQDDDGNAFFMLRQGRGSCRVSVGSDGPVPGLEVETYQQHGLACNVTTATGGPTDFVITMAADALLDGSADCDSTSTNMPHLCNQTWRAPDAKYLFSGVDSESEYLWTATIVSPANTNIYKVRRGADPGWGVDLKIINNTVQAGIQDDDGNAYFMLRQGGASCRVSVGSDGPVPGLELEIYRQHGLACNVATATGGPTDFVITMSADALLDGSADCDSTLCPQGGCSGITKKLCNKKWQAPSLTIVV